MDNKPIIYEPFTVDQWQEFPKDNFKKLIRRWCERHRFIQYTAPRQTICTHLPYRYKEKDRTTVEVAQDFLYMVDKYRAMNIFQPTLPV